MNDAQFSMRAVLNAADGLVDLIDDTPFGVVRRRTKRQPPPR